MRLCYCCKLETGVKVLATLFIVGSGIFVIGFLGYLSLSLLEVISNTMRDWTWWFWIIEILQVYLYLAWLNISILLLFGVYKRDAFKCQVWLIGNPIIYCLKIITSVFQVIYGPTTYSTASNVIMCLLAVVGIVICVYLFLVVQAFIDEIKNGQPQSMVTMDTELGQPHADAGEGQVIQNEGKAPTPHQIPSQIGQDTINKDG